MTIPRRRVALASLALVAACTSGSTHAGPTQSVSPTPSPTASPTPVATPSPYAGLALTKLGSFSEPDWVGPAPEDPLHLYLVEKTGRILRLASDGTEPTLVLDLSKATSHSSEQGVLSIAFDPRFVTDRWFYVDYTDTKGSIQVVRYTVDDAGLAGEPLTLLTVPHPLPNHNGGLLLFDPTGMLLVGTGDGGSAGDPNNLAQDLHSELGKILRIDPRTGAGLPDNPYPQDKRIWALGLRDPRRFSFDTNGDLYLGDVGQNQIEELDLVTRKNQRGANYGWSVFEGNTRYKKDAVFSTNGPVIAPAFTYLHSDGGCSITGGLVYRGHAIPTLVGTYVFGDYCAGRLLAAKRMPGGITPPELMGLKVEGLESFGVDAEGELLVLSANALFRLTAS